MEKAKELIKEMGTLMGQTDAHSEQRRQEIALWFKDNSTPENDALFDDFITKGVGQVAEENDKPKGFEGQALPVFPAEADAEGLFDAQSKEERDHQPQRKLELTYEQKIHKKKKKKYIDLNTRWLTQD